MDIPSHTGLYNYNSTIQNGWLRCSEDCRGHGNCTSMLGFDTILLEIVKPLTKYTVRKAINSRPVNLLAQLKPVTDIVVTGS